MYRIYKKILHAYPEDFNFFFVKSGIFRRNFTAHLRELLEDESDITCMIIKAVS